MRLTTIRTLIGFALALSASSISTGSSLQDARGQGLARLMYEDLFAAAKTAGQIRMVCEVNIDPPNEGSLAFHRSMGFVALADVVLKGDSKRVRYLVKELD